MSEGSPDIAMLKMNKPCFSLVLRSGDKLQFLFQTYRLLSLTDRDTLHVV